MNGAVLIAILSFLAAVFLLVTVHEYGHFWVARKLGFKVLRFSIGFGPTLWKRVSGADQTEYVIAAIPLGGYVKMLDEREGPVAASELERAFTRRPHWQRIAVLLAGPAANFLFAILVLSAVFLVQGRTELKPVVGEVAPDALMARAGLSTGDEFLAINGREVSGTDGVILRLLDGLSATEPLLMQVRGRDGAQRELRIALNSNAERRRLSDPERLFRELGFRFYTGSIPAVLGTVLPDGPAERAGLKAGDAIIAVNGESMRDFLALQTYINARADQTVTLSIRRDGQLQNLNVNVAGQEQAGKRVGYIMVRPAPAEPPAELLRKTSLGPLAAIGEACRASWEITAMQARFLWRMLIGQVSVKNISGPITMAELAGRSASAGMSEFLSFLVFVSLALGFMNLLPIPILDGGQIVMQSAEWIKGSPLSERAQMLGQQAGLLMVALLLGLALFNDLARQFG